MYGAESTIEREIDSIALCRRQLIRGASEVEHTAMDGYAHTTIVAIPSSGNPSRNEMSSPPTRFNPPIP